METKRMYLRRFKSDDLDDFYEYAQNPSVGLNAGWMPHPNIDVTKQVLDNFQADNGELAIVLKQSNKLIGSIGFHKDEKRRVDDAYMIGYCLSADYWGRGLMTEVVQYMIRYAFEDQEASILSIYHFPFNERSRRVIEKNGFIFEGRLRSSFTMPDGKLCDELCYSMLKEEYLLRKLADAL